MSIFSKIKKFFKPSNTLTKADIDFYKSEVDRYTHSDVKLTELGKNSVSTTDHKPEPQLIGSGLSKLKAFGKAIQEKIKEAVIPKQVTFTPEQPKFTYERGSGYGFDDSVKADLSLKQFDKKLDAIQGYFTEGTQNIDRVRGWLNSAIEQKGREAVATAIMNATEQGTTLQGSVLYDDESTADFLDTMSASLGEITGEQVVTSDFITFNDYS